eukprot:TRINITY_DN6324_c0_g1_i2.p1 TRINITY_DN6324_c0_g1~~TRINITY_DN6324_c0_g1_i2.p1  ORF type:complete len:499 (+),score=102.93 TRINITY_DN6324_c0_g1_i2:117-1613(+)
MNSQRTGAPLMPWLFSERIAFNRDLERIKNIVKKHLQRQLPEAEHPKQHAAFTELILGSDGVLNLQRRRHSNKHAQNKKMLQAIIDGRGSGKKRRTKHTLTQSEAKERLEAMELHKKTLAQALLNERDDDELGVDVQRLLLMLPATADSGNGIAKSLHRERHPFDCLPDDLKPDLVRYGTFTPRSAGRAPRGMMDTTPRRSSRVKQEGSESMTSVARVAAAGAHAPDAINRQARAKAGGNSSVAKAGGNSSVTKVSRVRQGSKRPQRRRSQRLTAMSVQKDIIDMPWPQRAEEMTTVVKSTHNPTTSSMTTSMTTSTTASMTTTSLASTTTSLEDKIYASHGTVGHGTFGGSITLPPLPSPSSSAQSASSLSDASVRPPTWESDDADTFDLALQNALPLGSWRLPSLPMDIADDNGRQSADPWVRRSSRLVSGPLFTHMLNTLACERLQTGDIDHMIDNSRLDFLGLRNLDSPQASRQSSAAVMEKLLAQAEQGHLAF